VFARTIKADNSRDTLKSDNQSASHLVCRASIHTLNGVCSERGMWLVKLKNTLSSVPVAVR
jgi:hypothetical protein